MVSVGPRVEKFSLRQCLSLSPVGGSNRPRRLLDDLGFSALEKLVSLSVLAMCFQFSSSALAADGDLFPAKIGNWWIYKTTDLKGKISDIKYSVTDWKQQKNGRVTFKIVLQSAKEQIAKFYEKRGGRTSLYHLEISGKSPRKIDYSLAQLVIDAQVRPGSVWQWNGVSNDPQKPSGRWQVFPNEKVKVPAGGFNCVKVGGLMVDRSVMIYQMRWYAPGVGIVNAIDRQGAAKTTDELKAFHVN